MLQAFLAREQILVTKETKKGTRELDLKPGIYRLTYEDGAFRMLLDASSGGNIKPVQMVEAILADQGEALQENALTIVREDVYTDIGAPAEGTQERKLVPLDDIGYLI